MPPKKSNHNSTPTGVNSPNGTTLVPSRRSPRVPVTVKSINQTPQSSKSLDLSSTSHSDPPFNFRLYNPNTPSTTGESRNTSPDLPSTRHRTFQTRPSRLSTVYPSTLDTPNSEQITRQTTRQSRRTSNLHTPHSQFADDEFSESIGSTGWTYDQYTGGFDFEESMARATSPSASSGTTRRSTRERKPTRKALESEQQQQQQQQKPPRRKNSKRTSQDIITPAETNPVDTLMPAEAQDQKEPKKRASTKRPRAETPALRPQKKAKIAVEDETLVKEANKGPNLEKTSLEKNPPKRAPAKRPRAVSPALPPRKRARTSAKDKAIITKDVPVQDSAPTKTQVGKKAEKITPAKPAEVETPSPAKADPTCVFAPPPVAKPVTSPAPTKPATRAAVKRGPTKVNKGKKTKPPTRPKSPTKPQSPTEPKPALQKLDLSVDEVGLRLLLCAAEALGPGFEPPSDPDKVIADARRLFEEGRARAQEEWEARAREENEARAQEESEARAQEESEARAQEESEARAQEASEARAQEESKARAQEENEARAREESLARAQEEDQGTADDASSIRKYKKTSPPRLENTGWALAGRTNDKGEKLVVTPPTNSPYWPPNTYADEALSQPPVCSRSDLDVGKDNALGFPPLIGDRNIPSSAEAQFQPEDVTEEQARMTARGKARQKNNSGSAGPTQTGKKARARKRRETKAAKVETATAEPTPGDGKSKPAQRRGARAQKAAAIKPEPEEAPVEDVDRPKIRIRLTLKPRAPTDEDPPTASSSSSVPAPVAPTRGKAAKPSVPRGKKGAVDLTSEAEPANKAPSKRARRAPRN